MLCPVFWLENCEKIDLYFQLQVGKPGTREMNYYFKLAEISSK